MIKRVLCVARFAPVFLALFLAGCGLPRGHRAGYVELGIEGPYVGRLEEGSLAARLGIKSGTQIATLNGTEIHSPADVERISDSLKLGDEVAIEIIKPGPSGMEREMLKGAVEESDIGRSSNYLVYGYEKIGDRTQRRWVHLGVITFGDWTGRFARMGLPPEAIQVDVLPEHVVRGAVAVAYLLPKSILLGIDQPDKMGMANAMMPTFVVGATDEADNEFALANASLFTRAQGHGANILSLWPVTGYLAESAGTERASELVYLTPLNSFGWGKGDCKGTTLAGIAYMRPAIKGVLPVYSYVDPKG